MNIVGLLYLLMAHFVAGRGVLALIRLQLPLVAIVCFSFIVGVPVVSFVPCLVQLAGIAITEGSIRNGIAILTTLSFVPILKWYKPPVFPSLKRPALYEWPFLLLAIVAIGTSLWRCWYYPVTPRDMLAGPEAIAEFAVREHTMVNSVYSVDLQTTNNQFKSPFVTALQIIYKLMVSPFGQVWLSVIVVPFMVWLYSVLRSTLHPLLAGMLFVLFLTIPDVYAYSFMILYDYSNMVFFFLGYYFLIGYLQGRDVKFLTFAAFLFGMATYIRTETLILVAFVVPVLAAHELKRFSVGKAAMNLAVFMLMPVLFYVVCAKVFVARFVPMPFDLGSQINHHLKDLSPFLLRLKETSTKLIFTGTGINVYGWFLFIFLAVLLLDLIFTRRVSHTARMALLGVVIVYMGLSFIGYLLPLADLVNTSKRGLFKLLPLALLYMANSTLLLRLSDRIRQWEERR